MPDAKSAAVYTRISRDVEGEGTGVERQETACRELADRLSLPVVAVYSDNDIGASDQSSSKKVRTGYVQLLADARKNQFTHIIAYSNSRLTRRMLELEDLIKLHEQTGVVIHTVVSGQDDLSTADGQFVARIKASMDAAESKRISERSRAAHRHTALKGEVKVQANRPFGFRADGVTHHPEEAELIRDAVMDIIRGATITQIQRKWESGGIKTSTGNDKWRWFPLRRVLLGARTAGIREYKGEPLYDADGNVVMGNWQPIISMTERAQALAALEAKSKKKVRQGSWLLSGLLRCGKCGRPLYGSLGTQKKASGDGEVGGYDRADTYSCNNENSHLGITAERLEKYLENVVYHYIMEKSVYGTPERPPTEVEDWPHEERLTHVSQKVDELMAAYNADTLPGSIVFPQVEKLDQERRELRRDRESFYASQAAVPQAVTNWWVATRSFQSMMRETFENRQLLLRQEVESVIVGPGVRGNAGKSSAAFEQRVTIQWREPHYEFNGRSAEVAAKELLAHMPLDKTFEARPIQLHPSRGPKAMAKAQHERELRRQDRERRAQRRDETS